MSTLDLAHALAQSLRDSEEFQQFLVAKEKITRDEGNHKMLREFQVKQWEIHQAQMFQEEVNEEKQQELERLYSLVSLNPSARAYLEAEFKVSRIVNDIQTIIGEAVQDAMPIGYEELNR